jgi:ubiquinone/menaquinone biosynthesis C-methylase UbiE
MFTAMQTTMGMMLCYSTPAIMQVIPAELDNRGYNRQLCADFSPRVVKMMKERHKSRSGIEWKEMDVRDMVGMTDQSVDVAFDKSTMDAMIYGSPWSPPDEVKHNTGRYLREVHRVLKDSGIFLYVTFRQPHFMRPLLDIDDLWTLDMEVLSSKGSFDYYGWVIRKASPRKEKLDDRPGEEKPDGK